MEVRKHCRQEQEEVVEELEFLISSSSAFSVTNNDFIDEECVPCAHDGYQLYTELQEDDHGNTRSLTYFSSLYYTTVKICAFCSNFNFNSNLIASLSSVSSAAAASSPSCSQHQHHHHHQFHSFFIGSGFAWIASFMDVIEVWKNQNENENGNETNDDNKHDVVVYVLHLGKKNKVFDSSAIIIHILESLRYWDTYKVFMVLATSFYLMESIFYLLTLKTPFSNHYNHNEDENGRNNSNEREDTIPIEKMDDLLSPSALPVQFEMETRSNATTIPTRNNSHNNTTAIAISMKIANLFGVAALFDFLSCLLEGDDDNDEDNNGSPIVVAYTCECISAVLFFASANILLHYKHNKEDSSFCRNLLQSTSTTPTPTISLLIYMGDIFFWFGCFTDLLVAMLDSPWMLLWISNKEKENNDNDINNNNNDDGYDSAELWTAIGGMVSATLWLIDAVLYELAGADLFDVQ